jgi:spore coat polysaccharide biosynthesis protein SpsF
VLVTTIAVIQARTGSTRFPGKVLADLRGRPMLAHVVQRVRSCATVDEVVVATTTHPADDPIVRLATGLGVPATRGPADDVLARFVTAAREYSADVVVRITADCPLVDPALVDAVVRLRAETGADYGSNVTPRTYPDGYDVEAMTRACLEGVDREAVTAAEREHVTLRVREHLEEYRIATLHAPRDLSALRVTVDYPEDLVRVSQLLEALAPDPMPGFADVSPLLEAGRGSGGDQASDAVDEARPAAVEVHG